MVTFLSFFDVFIFRPIRLFSQHMLPDKCKTKARKINNMVKDMGTRQHTGTCPIGRPKMHPNFTIDNFLGYAFDVLYMPIRVTEDCSLIFFTNLNV